MVFLDVLTFDCMLWQFLVCKEMFWWLTLGLENKAIFYSVESGLLKFIVYRSADDVDRGGVLYMFFYNFD